MCICAFKSEKTPQRFKKKTLSRCFERNPHGAGFAYSKNGNLYIKKGYFDFEKFWEEFDKIQHHTLIVHFRWASAGVINDDNCHPFKIANSHAMVHNGTLYDFVGNPEKTKFSDTKRYANLVLEPYLRRNPLSWKSKFSKYLLTKPLGRSKMIILSYTGEHLILNEEAGVWNKDIWYSNDGFKEFSEYEGTTLPLQLSIPFGEKE